MLGLVNRSIEVFLRTTYGEPLWQEVARKSSIDVRGFNSLREYKDDLTTTLLRNAAAKLGKPSLDILEDTGAWLVRLEPIRRLLRFSGSDFAEFVAALEELPGRARMAVPRLPFPPVTVVRLGPDHIRISGRDWPFGLQWMLAGALRGMADDYGVLVIIEARVEAVEMKVLVEGYTDSRPFDFSPQLEQGHPQ
ncbi:heme NO-binding domain-containing protein [Paracoccus aminophilus]|uniref:Heme NO binding domain-containing protein n=1 Tax=Paracoccus aminophilus JCM 7686 TaxID=1367847 RepID=S5YD74_PARAH|nr:heme NO-binding domain-containing protein [Paracoccus aminophilus]AGT09408.1 heme NO binding domain-containing protein [Paracoccus aminophilus JCM 7686]